MITSLSAWTKAIWSAILDSMVCELFLPVMNKHTFVIKKIQKHYRKICEMMGISYATYAVSVYDISVTTEVSI